MLNYLYRLPKSVGILSEIRMINTVVNDLTLSNFTFSCLAYKEAIVTSSANGGIKNDYSLWLQCICNFEEDVY